MSYDTSEQPPVDERAELYKTLVDRLYAMPAPDRRTAYWMMNRESWERIRLLFPPEGVLSDPLALLGKRVIIDGDAGEPHLESCPVDWVTIERTRIIEAAVQAADGPFIPMAALVRAVYPEES